MTTIDDVKRVLHDEVDWAVSDERATRLDGVRRKVVHARQIRAAVASTAVVLVTVAMITVPKLIDRPGAPDAGPPAVAPADVVPTVQGTWHQRRAPEAFWHDSELWWGRDDALVPERKGAVQSPSIGTSVPRIEQFMLVGSLGADTASRVEVRIDGRVVALVSGGGLALLRVPQRAEGLAWVEVRELAPLRDDVTLHIVGYQPWRGDLPTYSLPHL